VEVGLSELDFCAVYLDEHRFLSLSEAFHELSYFGIPVVQAQDGSPMLAGF